MTQQTEEIWMEGLPPLVGLRVVVVSDGLERAYDRGRVLEEMGYRVAACGDPGRAKSFVSEMEADAVVIDLQREVSFPADVCMRLRSLTDSPIIVVGNAGSLAEMVRCFEAGADTYCRPGCQTEEIDLRLRAIMRRSKKPHADRQRPARQLLQVGEIEIDPAGQVVRKRGNVIPLSPTEFRLLMTLAEHQGEVVPSKALIARVWGNQYSSETHYLRLYVRYLRQKLEDDPSNPRYIVNRWGSGYALESPKQAA